MTPMNPTPNDITTDQAEVNFSVATLPASPSDLPSPSLLGNITGNGMTKVYLTWPGLKKIHLGETTVDGGVIWFDDVDTGFLVRLYNCSGGAVVGQVGVPPIPEQGIWASIRRAWAWFIALFS